MGMTRFRFLLLILCVCFIGQAFLPNPAEASVEYRTFSRDSYGRVIWTQSAYLPVSVMATDLQMKDPQKPGETIPTSLNNPQDLFVADNDDLYIADTGNNRIVHLDPDGKLIGIVDMPDNALRKPEGVFVDKKGFLYIADTGNNRIVLADPQGRFVRDYHAPESKYIPKTYQFDPFKLVVDRRGFMYIASKGSYEGLMLMDPKGEFHGFFGANPTNATLFERFKLRIYSEQQLSREVRLLPNPVQSVHIDDTGFVYTTTLGLKNEQIKKFNIRSENQLKGLSFGELFDAKAVHDLPQLMDVTVDRNHNIITIDAASGTVNVYNTHGELLFFWTGHMIPGQTQLGLTHSPIAIASNSKNELFIVDSIENNIQRMAPSHFGELVFKAMSLMGEGKYEESVPFFNEIIRLNANFSQANKGLGLAAFHEGNYSQSLHMFNIAGDKKDYSDAYWQLRLEWFQHHFPIVADTLLILGAVWLIWHFFLRRMSLRIRKGGRRKIRLAEQLLHCFTMIKHPIEGFVDLRYDKKGSYLSAFILLVLTFLSILFKIYYTNFHFTGNTPVYEIKSGVVLLQFVVLWMSWVISNYLISTIYHGEGRLSDVFIGSAYALSPIILLAVPVAVISKALTLSELSIYNFFNWLMIGWVALMLFWKVKALQNYSVGETVINIGFTIVAFLVLWVVSFIIFGLVSQFTDFVYSVYQEVSMR